MRFGVALREVRRAGMIVRVGAAAFRSIEPIFYSELNMEITVPDDAGCFPR